jgi:hypothetical protein
VRLGKSLCERVEVKKMGDSIVIPIAADGFGEDSFTDKEPPGFGSLVRTRLPARGRRIRTVGPSVMTSTRMAWKGARALCAWSAEMRAHP